MLKIAYRDFRALQAMGDSEEFADAIVGFHAQQAVEKALKAWLFLLDQSFPLTHDLKLLFQLVEKHGHDLSRHNNLLSLTLFAVTIRYDADDTTKEDLDRFEMTARVHELLERVNQVVAGGAA